MADNNDNNNSGLDVAAPERDIQAYKPPARLLMGPGPCNVEPSVLCAMAAPLVGHLDPVFLEIVEDCKDMMRYVWQTTNKYTFPVSGTGSAAMECVIGNLTEPGDKVLVFANGYFGHRAEAMAARYGGEVVRVDRAWGTAFTLEEVAEAIERESPALVFLVHAETSTGCLQPMEGIGELVHAAGALLILDTVTSMGGVPTFLDRWGVDAAYSGGQKCLSCPPGCSPVTFNDAAKDKALGRESQIPNWYLDLSLLAGYLDDAKPKRSYHHTAPITMVYALREALRVVVEEGLEERWARHAATAQAMWDACEDVGLGLQVDRAVRLPSLCTVQIPDGIDGYAVTKYLLDNYNIEIGNGLGAELAGKVWRIGLMGYNSRAENVVFILAALKEALIAQGWVPATRSQL